MGLENRFETRMQRWRDRRLRGRRGELLEAEVALDKAAVLVAQEDAGAWAVYVGLLVKKIVDLARERGGSEADLEAFIGVVYEQGARRLIKVV